MTGLRLKWAAFVEEDSDEENGGQNIEDGEGADRETHNNLKNIIGRVRGHGGSKDEDDTHRDYATDDQGGNSG